RAQVWHRQREDMAVAVLVLQSFPGKRRASRGSAEQEAARAHVRRGPDEIRDALKPEHRVKNKKWYRVDPVGGVRGARSDKRRHRTRFRDSLFENLSVLRFFVIQQRVHIDRLVALARTGINTDRAEERLHAKR